MKRPISIKGIVRATPDNVDGDGNCQEVINMRFKDGAWRSVGTKEDQTGEDLDSNYQNFYKHPILPAHYIIAEKTSTDKIVVTNPADPLFETAIVHLDSEGSDLVGYAHINDFLIVTTTVAKHTFKWDEGSLQYDELEPLEAPHLSVHEGTLEINQETAVASDYEEARIKYRALVASKRAANKLEGHMLFRMAWRMYDNSLVAYSAIQHYNIRGDGADAHTYETASFVFSNLAFSSIEMQLYVTAAHKALLTEYEGLIKSLVIFSTDIHSHFDVSDDDPSGWASAGGDFVYLPDQPGIEEIMIQKSGYYNIKEIPYDEIQGLAGNELDLGEIDLSFIDSIEVRESLPLYASPHDIGGKTSTIYNGKIHMGYIYEFLNQGNIHSHYDKDKAGYVNMSIASSLKKFYYCFYLDTDQGEKIVIREFRVFDFDDGAAEHYVLMNPITIYPDNRCFKVVPIQYDNGTSKYYYMDFAEEILMKPHPSLNFSYAVEDDFDPLLTGFDAATGVGSETSLPTESKTLTYKNKWRLSALNSPITFPAINTYVIEDTSAEILAFGLMSEPLSESQVGQFPIYLFTDKGIFAAEVGTGDIAYSNAHMINRQICNNADSVTGLGGMIIFATEFGLRILKGREVMEISTAIEGTPTDPLLNSGITTYIDDSEVILAEGDISEDDFLDYIEGAIIGYDYENKEIIVSNPETGRGGASYSYSYVYCIENGMWHKIDTMYVAFFHELPDLFAFDDSYNLIKMNEETSDYKNVLIYTRPFQLGTMAFKKIKAGILDGYLSKEDDTFGAIYLYGSNDLKDWALVTATELDKELIQYTPEIYPSHFSVKYFILLISGSFKDTTFKDVIFEFEEKFNNRLR